MTSQSSRPEDLPSWGDHPARARSLQEQEEHAWALDEARRRVLTHPFYVAFMEQENLRITLEEVFLPNARELQALLEAAATDFDLAVELVQNVHQPMVAEKFLGDLTQRLHNYLASTYTLIEHTRAVMKRRERAQGRVVDPIAKGFAAKKRELLSDPVVMFVRDLRTYVQHYGHVPIHRRLSMNEATAGRAWRSEILLDSAPLLEWKRWSSPVSQFLATLDSVNLHSAVDLHCVCVERLNRWFLQELVTESEPMRAECNDLVTRYNGVLSGLAEPDARRLTEEITRQRESPAGFSVPWKDDQSDATPRRGPG